jgi:D-alanine-D-alanine ligase-like ATP-grasp enzyme
MTMHENQRLLVKELKKRGVRISVTDKNIELLEASYKNHKEFLLDRDSSVTPYNVSVMSGDKYLTKKLLKKAGISVAEGELFNDTKIDDALIYAQKLRYPIVVKPNFGSHGNGIHTDIQNIFEAKKAVEDVQKNPFIIEKQFFGNEYRVFITKEGKYAVLHRDPASIIGDGVKCF